MVDSSVDITLAMIKELISDQFAHWSDLSINPVKHIGHDRRTFHLGNEMLIRLPSTQRYAAKVEKEQKWLPFLANYLSTEIPKPISMGRPSDVYPWNWSVYKWIEGESANHLSCDNKVLNSIGLSLAKFINELHKIDTTNAPEPGAHNFYRGGHPSVYSEETYRAINNLSEVINTQAATELWERAISTRWNDKPVWVHGDFASGNVIIKDKQLAAVIDFSGICVGDPACDLVIAWTFLKGESRELFKKSVGLDKDTWDRARGWALWKALITLNNIKNKNSDQAIVQIELISDLLKESEIQIRNFDKSDVKQLVDLFYNTIHNINIKDYNEEQIDAWAPKSSLEVEGWLKKWNKLPPIVAKRDTKIVGFAEFDEKTGYIDCFYCHHEYIGQGVGSKMMKEILKRAEVNNTNRIYANVSITAKPFFEYYGFLLVKDQIVECRGVKLKNYVMEKMLNV
jgi:aminoglycoside phosphotransferase (APT) family kinase protein/GNAT superfamily N-acetyltransferase